MLVIGVGLVSVSGCSADCRESDGASQSSPDGRHSVEAVHKSCGGAAGAEEDLVYVVSGGDRTLGLRVHHQVGPVVLTWIDADHVTVTLSESAAVVESDSPVDGVELVAVDH